MIATELTVGKDARLVNAFERINKYIRKAMTLDNPQYLEAQRHGRWTGNLAPEIRLYTELENGIAFPRGWARNCLELLKQNGIEAQVNDHRRLLQPIQLAFRGTLRGYQQEAVERAIKRDFGVISSATGSGKTVIALAIIAEREQPCLVLVHNKELMYQWQDRIKSFLGIEPGLIGDGKVDVQPVTVGIVNTARKHLDSLPQHFGHVVVDECFPVGTRITTDSGVKRIEQLKPGDTVKGYDHNKKKVVDSEVKHLFQRKSDSFCEIRLVDGQVITCTPEHPIWVGNTYLPARKLKAGQMVWRMKNARNVRNKQSNKAKKQGCCCSLCELRGTCKMQRQESMADIFSPGQSRKSLLLTTMCGSNKTQVLGTKRKKSLGIQQKCGQDEQDSRQPNEKAGRCKKNGRVQSQKWNTSSSTFCKRGERDWTDKSPKNACRCTRVFNRSSCQNCSPFTPREAKSIPKSAWIPNMLQSGHSRSFFQNSYRGGRRKSQWTACSHGSEESRVLEGVRVESVAFNEQANRGGSSGKRENCLVYNIETSTGNYFAEGCLVHNCHRVPSSMFTEAVQAFDSKYMLGLSATAYRRDKLTKLIYLALGDRVHEVDPKELKQNGAVLVPEVIRRETAFAYAYCDDYQAMLSALVQDQDRNLQIADDVVQQARSRSGTCLVVSDRVAHCRTLAELIEQGGLQVRILTGQSPKTERERTVAEVQEGQVDVLVSTVQLLGEGFDCSGLSSLFLATPIKFKGRVLQVVGRILRPSDGKAPVVFDYVDTEQPVLKAQAKSRSRALQEVAAY